MINYVDDTLYYASDNKTRQSFKSPLKKRSNLILMGVAKWYLGMCIKHENYYVTLDQDQYMKNMVS